MKKNIRLNKQIIKALSVGISASMLMQPITSMAAETDTNTTSTTPVDGAESTTVTSANDYAGTVSIAEDADYLVDEAIDASNTAVDTVSDEAKQPVKDAADGLASAISENEEELKNDCDEAKADVEAMEEQALIIAADVSAAESYENTANTAANTANADVSAAEKLAYDTDVSVNEAVESVSANEQALKEAGTIDEANAIYDTIAATVSENDKMVNTAEAEFTSLENEFNAAETTYNQKSQAYADILVALKDAEEAYAALQVSGNNETVDALERLEALRVEAENLKIEAGKAFNEYVSSGYGYIAYLEYQSTHQEDFFTEKDNLWRKLYDKIFSAMIKEYYVPYIKNVNDENKTYKVVKTTWTRVSKEKLNYCTVIFEDEEGNQYTEILDYRLEEGNKSGGLVIFEKVPHLILENVDLVGEDLALVEAGEIVEIVYDGKPCFIKKTEDGKYGVYDIKEAGEVFVTETDTTENGTKAGEIVEIDNEEVSYEYENGTLVKKVVGDVTTTTYTGAKLDAASATLSSVEAAKAAYARALQSKIDALDGDDVIVIGGVELAKGYEVDATNPIGFELDSDEVITSYTTTATYVQKHTDRRNISGGWSRFETVADSEYSIVKGTTQAVMETEHVLDRIVSRTSDSSVESKEVKGLFNTKHTEYRRNGYVQYEYLDITTKSDHFSFLEGDSLSDAKEEAKAWVEAQGGIFIDFYGIDLKWKQGTIVYIAGTTVTADGATEAAAEAAAARKAGSSAYNYKASTVANTDMAYGYKELEYFIKHVSVEEKAKISTTEWVSALTNAKLDYKNDKFNSGDVIFAEYDHDYLDESGKNTVTITGDAATHTDQFRFYVDQARAVADMYRDTQQNAADAEAAINAAKARVQDLQDAIKALEAEGGDFAELIKLQGNLAHAKQVLEAAIAKRNALNDKLDEIADELQRKIDELTPQTQPSGPVRRPTTPTEPTEDLGTPAVATLLATPAPALVNIPDEDVPQAETPEDDTQENPTDVAEVDVPDDEVALAAAPVTVGDDATPLASIPEAKEMSWWWLLIVLVLGATGAEMYRRHMAKKKAAEATIDEK